LWIFSRSRFTRSLQSARISNCENPITPVSGLFSSWATPDTSSPSAESFSAWISCSWARLSSAIDPFSRVLASTISWCIFVEARSASFCSRRSETIAKVPTSWLF